MRLLDRPIIWIVIFGALPAFVWEAFRMPFYAMDRHSHRQMTMTWALASIADAQVVVSASWGWRYSEAMPVIPGTTIGIVPLLMWIMVPLVTLWLARRMTRRAA